MGCGASAKYETLERSSSGNKDWSEDGGKIEGLRRGSVVLRRGSSGMLQSYYNFKSEGSDGGTASKDLPLARKSIGSIQKTTSLASQLDRACRRIRKDTRTAESIETEIEMLREMDHPGIAHVYEVFENDTYHSIITDHCSLGSLAQVVIDRTTLSEPEAAAVLQHLARVVIYLHDKKICHRGLRPEAVMLHLSQQDAPNLNDCSVKVIDFSHAVHFKRGKSILGKVDTFSYSSPQLLDGECTEACDAWSCGAILYTMLCGKPPFGGDIVEVPLSEEEQSQLKTRAADESRQWGDEFEARVSKKGKKLIKRLLDSSEENRMRVEHIIGDAWGEQQGLEAFSHVPLNTRHLENMNEFSCANPLKKIALNIVAQRIPEDDIKDLRAIFDSMDLDKNGIVTYKELKVALDDVDSHSMSSWRHKQAYPVDPKALMNLLDTNGSLELDFTEFVAAALNKDQYSNESLLLAAFKAIDTDGSGEIDIHELTEVLMDDKMKSAKEDDTGKADWLTEVLAEADGDGSGEIDFEEFKNLIMKVSLPDRKGEAPVVFAKKESFKEQERRLSRQTSGGSHSRAPSADSTKSGRSRRSVRSNDNLQVKATRSRESSRSRS